MENAGANYILSPSMSQILDIAIADLKKAGVENAFNEARWMAENAGPELFQQRIARRIKGEPLQYILGEVPFHDIKLKVGPGVLIPRPETEQLVEIALSYRPQGDICDLCTGSGAIALAMAHSMPQLHFIGIDISDAALNWATQNKELNALHNVDFMLGDLYSPLDDDAHFAMITANPPYVSPEEYSILEDVVKKHEPRLALEAENKGLAVIENIAEGAQKHLLPQGVLIMEIGETQGNAVKSILDNSGLDVKITRDYAGKERFAIAKRK